MQDAECEYGIVSRKASCICMQKEWLSIKWRWLSMGSYGRDSWVETHAWRIHAGLDMPRSKWEKNPHNLHENKNV